MNRSLFAMAIPLIGAMTVAGCGSNSSTSEDGEYYREAGYAFDDEFEEEEPEPFDEDEARRVASDQLASEGYDYSYGCTIDCSGHEAGWQWGAENGYSTYGNSQSFHEGTMAFEDALDDRVREMEDDYDNGEEVY